MENRRKSKINIISSLARQCLTAILGILLPRLILTSLGSESNGLVTSINNILVYVALLEAGVGAAAEQALFKPLKDNNHQKINEILSATSFFYKRTGLMYGLVVIAMSLILPFTIETNLSTYDVMLVVLLSGLPGVINYIFQGKFCVLLKSDGRSYVQTNINTAVYVFTTLSKIILLINGYGIVLIQSVNVITNIIQVIFIEIYIHKHYKWLNINSIPDYSEIKQSKNAFIHQIAWMVTSNTDVIVLTYFCGLKTVSVYSIYAYIYNTIDGLVSSLPNGMHFVLGQEFQSDKKKYVRIHDLYENAVLLLCFSIFCIVAIFTNPFLKLYTRGINDIKYVDSYLPFLFMAAHILVQCRTTSWATISVAGDFKGTQHQPIIEAIINIVSSVLLVIHCGIYGVLIGTIIASTYRVVVMIYYARKKILHDNPWITFRRYITNILALCFIIFLSNRLIPMDSLDSYISIIFYALLVGLATVFIFLIFNILSERKLLTSLINYLFYRKL